MRGLLGGAPAACGLLDQVLSVERYGFHLMGGNNCEAAENAAPAEPSVSN